MDIVQVPYQYVVTVVDFVLLKRPKRFAEALSDNPSRYANPYLFLVVNIALSGVLFAWTLVSRDLPAKEVPSKTEATLLFAAFAVLHCIISVPVGRLAGFLLNERTDVSVLFSAFCYTSVFYPIEVPFIANVFDPSGADPQILLFVVVGLIQLLALGYLLATMAHLSDLHGRRLLAFASVSSAGIIFLLLTVTFGALALAAMRSHEHYSFALCESAEAWPVAAITLPAQAVTSDTAVLTGATVGRRTRENFQIGSDKNLRNTVTARDGVATIQGLSPGTTYLFRYVTRHGGATCVGRTLSFTTKPI